MGKDYYKILGVEPGAGKDEIKRAYFRLVRKYSPENDPEHFQEIREAYENLKEGDAQEKPKLECPDDQAAIKSLNEIMGAVSSNHYLSARKAAEECVKGFGEYECFLFYLGLAQRNTGQTGKAVKTFEKLTNKYPDKLIHHRELAMSYLERGFTKKAVVAFKNAYDMGERGLDFLRCYSILCVTRYNMHDALTLLFEAVDICFVDRVKYCEEALDFISVIGIINQRILLTDDEKHKMCKILEKFSELMTNMPGQVRNDSEPFGRIILLFLAKIDRENTEEFNVVKELNEKFVALIDKKEIKEWNKALEQMEFASISENLYLPDCLDVIIEAVIGDMPNNKFAMLETKLLIIEEWPDIKESIAEFGRMYPIAYTKLKPFIDELTQSYQNGKVDDLKNNLLKKHTRMERYFDSGLYYDRYPRKSDVHISSVWDSETNGTFVRDGKKIGRNEPCPCGSGKKYKNCCGRK